MVDRPQFTDEQRAFVVLKCEKYKASALDTVSGSLITLHKSSWDSEQNSHEGKRMNHFIWLVLKIFNVWEFEALSKNWGGYLESFQSPDLKWDPFWTFSEKNLSIQKFTNTCLCLDSNGEDCQNVQQKFTFQNCISKASPGETHSGAKKTARTPENIEAVWVGVTAEQIKPRIYFIQLLSLTVKR